MVRTIGSSLPMVMALLSSTSAEAHITVAGHNNPAVDILAVQRAVDQGGTIHLKGTFDFGNEGRVNITKDVQIIGDTNPGGPVTKITGGFWTFHSPLPAQLPPTAPGPRIRIQGIHFDGALWTPVLLAYSSGATISNNKITNLKPRAMGEQPIFGRPGLNMQQGIVCHPGYAQVPWETRKYIPNAFTGNLIIEDNDIDLTNDVPTKTMAQGVILIWTTGIKARIQRNTVINCARNSIEAIDNYADKDGSGTIIIDDNKIVTSVEGLPVPGPITPNGIIVGWVFDMSGGCDPQRNIKHVVANNDIRTRGKTSAGIVSVTDGAVVVDNSIFSEGTEALPLLIASSDGYIARNKAEGKSSSPGVLVRTLKPLKGSRNVIMDNDLRQFQTPAADVVFAEDTRNNVFTGSKSKVSDLGSNHSIQMTR